MHQYKKVKQLSLSYESASNSSIRQFGSNRERLNSLNSQAFWVKEFPEGVCLKLGSSDKTRVLMVQEFIRAHQSEIRTELILDKDGSCDGDYGKNTRQCVAELQNNIESKLKLQSSSETIVVDGLFGHQTAHFVDQFYDSKPVVSSNYSLSNSSHNQSSNSSSKTAVIGTANFGEKSDNVELIQDVLNSFGAKNSKGNPISVDGDYGEETRMNVDAFQIVNNMFALGDVNSATVSRLSQSNSSRISSEAIEAALPNLSLVGRIEQGRKGAIAQRVQQRLNFFQAKISEDGDFGAGTTERVLMFQEANNLPQNGIVEGETRRLLNRDTANAISAPVRNSTIESLDPNLLSERAKRTLHRILEVLERASQKSRYDQVYNTDIAGLGHEGDSVRQYYVDSLSRRNNSEYNVEVLAVGDSVDIPIPPRVYPEILLQTSNENIVDGKGLGLEHMIDFVKSGGYDNLLKEDGDTKEQDVFDRSVEEIGSFYGGYSRRNGEIQQGGIDNQYTWFMSTEQDQYAGYAKQSDDFVGRWDCSSLTSHVSGRGYTDTRGMMDNWNPYTVDWNQILADNNQDAFAEVAPAGSILVKRGNSGNHAKTIIGHLGGKYLVIDSGRSKDFVHAETITMQEMADRFHEEYKVVHVDNVRPSSPYIQG